MNTHPIQCVCANRRNRPKKNVSMKEQIDKGMRACSQEKNSPKQFTSIFCILPVFRETWKQDETSTLQFININIEAPSVVNEKST